jgi:hypothetical protein
MNIRDYSKIQRGYRILGEARDANRRGDFEEAARKDLEAAQSLRKGYIKPPVHAWEKIFFAECKAVEIFEGLVKRGRHDLFEIYEKVGEGFLKDWVEENIKYRLRYRSAVRNALTDLNLRLSEFERIHAEKLLKEPESPGRVRVIADCYKRAAEALQSLKNLDSRKYMEREPNMNWHWSHHYKFAAFEYLQDKKMQDIMPEIALEKAGQNLTQGIDSAEKSIRYDSSVFSETHLLYLKYWRAVVYERLHLLNFMKEGKYEEWKSASQNWQEALQIVEMKPVREESFFPNRFYSIRDLRLENEFLEATRHFRNQDWKSCTYHLENWCRSFPVEYYLTWRHIQGYVRLLVAETFQAFIDHDKEKLKKVCNDLMKIRHWEPIGNAAKFLCAKTVTLLTPERLAENPSIGTVELADLWKYFPFDSYREDRLPDEELLKPNPLLSLHPTIQKQVERAERVTKDSEIPKLRAEFFGSVEAFLCYLYDYYSQELVRNLTPDLDELIVKHNLEKLIEGFYQFMYSEWKGSKRIFDALKELKKSVRQLSDSQNLKPYIHAYYKARKAISDLAQFAPVVVTISSVTLSEKLPIIERLPDWQAVKSEDLTITQPRIVEARPNWSLCEHRLGREKFFISLSAEMILKPDDYYLPPEWRKGMGVFCQLAGKRSLFPVRFKPMWDFWETEAGIIYLKLQREKAVFVLGKYGENEPLERQEFYLGELTKVRDYLRSRGYSAYLVKEMPDFSKLIEQKEKLCILASRFCIWLYYDPSWAISEYEYAKELKTVLAILPAKGLLTRLRQEIKTVPILYIEVFEFEKSPLEKESIVAAVDWAEKFLGERRT